MIKNLIFNRQVINQINCKFINKNYFQKNLLNIAYFGSDEFSVNVLKHFNSYIELTKNKVKKLHVITNSYKKIGKNPKKLLDIPIVFYCTQNESNILMSRVESEDDIIALGFEYKFDIALVASFGKLIPEKFLKTCKYGGYNLHPSLLPKYTGPSPIHTALINDDNFTGCSLQSLHPTEFDKGKIILQSKEINILDNDNYKSLVEKLSNVGGKLLINFIQNNFFLDTNQDKLKPIKNYPAIKTLKIKSNDNEIKWNLYSTRKIKRIYDVFNKLHTFFHVNLCKKKNYVKGYKKIIFYNVEFHDDKLDTINNFKTSGQFDLRYDSNNKPSLIIKTIDGHISVSQLTFESYNKESAFNFFNSLKKRSGHTNQIFTSNY